MDLHDVLCLYEPVYGNGGSPALVGDLLVFSCDGEDQQFVVALDKVSGVTRWRTDRRCNLENKLAFSTPLVIDMAGRRQLVSPAAGAIIGCDTRTSNVAAQQLLRKAGYRQIATLTNHWYNHDYDLWEKLIG